MATKAINLNEKIPQEEDIDNPAQTLDVADPPPSAQSDHPVNGSDDPPPSNTDVVADGSAKEAGEAKSTVDPVESLADETGDTVNDMQKKIRRAERFGLPVQLSEQEKRTSRAERFGTGSGPNRSDELDKSEALKRKARAERFGVSVSSVTTDEEAKKKARLARFNSGAKVDPQEEEKRKARAIRFSNPPLNSGSQVNGEEAIAGKASGGS